MLNLMNLRLMEEHRLKSFENRVLRRIFIPKRDEIIGGWRKLHNDELHNLHSLPDIIIMIKSRRIRCVGHVACMRAKTNSYRVLVEKPEGKRPLGGSKLRGRILLKWIL
jgi:hypothetical protein